MRVKSDMIEDVSDFGTSSLANMVDGVGATFEVWLGESIGLATEEVDRLLSLLRLFPSLGKNSYNGC